LVEIFHGWWGYPRLVPEIATRPADTGRTDADRRGRGLFFSGGVDSFHALLHRDQPIDLLVFVEGLDISLSDVPRTEAALAGVREVSAETGIRLAVVRTNLRDHALIHATSWERANGGALAAIAHVLAGSVHEMIIASSIAI